MKIEMVDLKKQYSKIKASVDSAVFKVIKDANFINGIEVKAFSDKLTKYFNGAYVIPCANGTDALQIAMMALDLKPGDEVIVPAFTYVATAEVIGLLNLKPVMIDVDEENFNISIGEIRKAITDKTKAIVPVHLYGQCANMEEIMSIAKEFNLYVIEDTAQAIGAEYIYSKNKKKQAGTIGDIGCTSFFPSKNLGCYGDGGAVYTTNKLLAEKITMIANHGQEVKYVHKYIGVNSRLDTIQAAILNIKLDHLNEYINARQKAAQIYDQLLSDINQIQIPIRAKYSSHVYHQYTIIVKENKRDELKKHLESCDIPSMIYYPVPLNEQEAFKFIGSVSGELTNTNKLCKSVLSLPMHTELTLQEQEFISNEIHKYFKNAS
jgi:UDP-2-acetamido-2-deoxy-ribo-hexuluronate aminotransferase